MIKRLSKIFFELFLITFPWQVHFIWYEKTAYATGLFASSSAFIIYIADIFLIIALILFLFSFKKKWQWGSQVITIGMISLIFITQCTIFWALDPLLVFYGTIRLILLFIVYLLIINKIIAIPKIIYLLIFSALFQAILVIWQTIFQTPFGLHFLGEPYFTTETLGIAKLNINRFKWVRGYGTFAHPNALAGFLFIIFFLINILKKVHYKELIQITILIGLFLTASKSSIFALIISIIFYILFIKKENQSRDLLIKKIFIIGVFVIMSSLILPFESIFGESFRARFQLSQISLNMINNNFFGVGFKHFILHMADFIPTKLFPWEFQPVHNIYLLITSELGIISGILFIIYLIKIYFSLLAKIAYQESKIFITILFGIGVVIFNLDHYYWDIYATQTIFWIFLALISQFLSNLPVRPSLRTSKKPVPSLPHPLKLDVDS